MLQAAGQRPGLALQLLAQDITPELWRQWPQDVARGQTQTLQDLTLPQLLDVLQKLCHDLWLSAVGASPRFFDAADLPKAPGLRALQQWSVALQQHMKTMEHPFHAGLASQALLSQARAAINSRT